MQIAAVTVPEAATLQLPLTNADVDSPKTLSCKRKFSKQQEEIASLRKKVYNLERKNNRLHAKLSNLDSIISELKSKFFISDEISQALHGAGTSVTNIFQRVSTKMRSKKSNLKSHHYSESIRSFAITLHFYSPRAYEYVRKTFINCLPHERTLKKWFTNVSNKPGFSDDSFIALETKVKFLKQQGKHAPCALLMDEMAIRKHVEWINDDNVYGHVDLGMDDNDKCTAKVATEALVFMVVSMNDSWKLPVGYFFANSLSAEEKSNLVKKCLTLLHSVGVDVKSLTFDGAGTNIKMAHIFGSRLTLGDIKHTFPHPVTSEDVCIILDASHMVKLIRNLLGDKKKLIDGNGNVIRYELIENLHNLQNSTGIHLRNKLRSAHMQYFKKKMNVRLATQMLSNSVADAIEFCTKSKIDGFEDSEATVTFIRTINRLFDVFNTRNLLGFGYKKPLSDENYSEIVNQLSKDRNYLSSLTCTESGKRMVETQRRTGLIGFICNIQSLDTLFIGLQKMNISYFLTYKISQDHLELFFGKIRSRLGCNNNPTVRQFIAAYKRLLVHNDISHVTR